LESYLLPVVLYNTPKVLYINLEKEKENMLFENKGKCGIYIWINKLNGKQYVGSAKDLGDRKSGRLNWYFRSSYLTNSSLGSSAIRSAIQKYGYENFMVGILEYTTHEELVLREQFYIDQLSPEYNILKLAYSSLGYKHTEESLNKMRGLRPNYSLSETHKETIRNLNRNRIFSQESLNKIITKVSKPVYVYTPELKLINKYSAITIAKKELKISTTTINKYCLSNQTYKNKYKFSFTPLHDVTQD
jgi:group I intron endonuclease